MKRNEKRMAKLRAEHFTRIMEYYAQGKVLGASIADSLNYEQFVQVYEYFHGFAPTPETELCDCYISLMPMIAEFTAEEVVGTSDEDCMFDSAMFIKGWCAAIIEFFAAEIIHQPRLSRK